MQVQDLKLINMLQPALQKLSQGNLVIYPTETCYGLAVDATNPTAVTKLLAYKGDRHRQVSIAVADEAMARKYVSLNPIARNLYDNFLPGPITVISESLHLVDSRLESSHGTLGVRFPGHTFALSLIQAFGKPITATSANTSGKKEPYSLADWQKYTTLAKQSLVSLFLDAGKLEERPTSTVVDTTLNNPLVLRQGELILPNSSPSYVSRGEGDTQKFATNLIAKHLNLTRRFPLIIALQGDLGVGKTQFAKGIASAIGIDETVSSPTYTLMREYPYNTTKYSGMLYHIDTWRLSDPAELESTLNLPKLLVPGNILVIEWAGKAKSLLESLKSNTTIILIDIKEKDENNRIISYALSTPEWS